MIWSQILGDHTVGEVLIVSDTNERKAEMAKRSDAFIALPGIFLFIYLLLCLIISSLCWCVFILFYFTFFFWVN